MNQSSKPLLGASEILFAHMLVPFISLLPRGLFKLTISKLGMTLPQQGSSLTFFLARSLEGTPCICCSLDCLLVLLGRHLNIFQRSPIFSDCSGGSPSEGHKAPRGSLRKFASHRALRGSLRGLCGGLSEGSAGVSPRVLRGSAGFFPQGFSGVVTLCFWPSGTVGQSTQMSARSFVNHWLVPPKTLFRTSWGEDAS